MKDGYRSRSLQLVPVNAMDVKTHTHTHLISGQDLEGGDDLVCRVCVCYFPGHEVNEGLEGDSAAAVGVYYGHDARELSVALATRKYPLNPGERAACTQTHGREHDMVREHLKHRDRRETAQPVN